MEQNTIVTLIGNVGFPMTVAIYLLVRVEKKIELLTAAINKLNLTVQKNIQQ